MMYQDRVTTDRVHVDGDRQRRMSRLEAEAMASGEEKSSSWVDRAARCVGDHPKISLAAALAAGVLVGWLIKRR